MLLYPSNFKTQDSGAQTSYPYYCPGLMLLQLEVSWVYLLQPLVPKWHRNIETMRPVYSVVHTVFKIIRQV